MVEKQVKVGNFTIRHLGQNHYVIYPHPDVKANNAIVITGWGTTDKEYIHIPFFHRVIKLILIQLDSSYLQASDQLEVLFHSEATKSVLGKYVQDILLNEVWVQTPIAREVYGEGFEYEPREWTLELEGTATNLVIPILYIQKLEG